MIQKFATIKKEYDAFDKETQEKCGYRVRDTAKGIWGASDLSIVMFLFKKIKLQKFKNFLDLGCGDGRVVLTASLFTQATGIEIDKELIDKGKEIMKKLKINNTELHEGDIVHYDVSAYDLLFINPDTGFHNGLEDKLLKELKGTLLVYNNVFLPRFLRRGKTHWFNQIPITEFTKVNDEDTNND